MSQYANSQGARIYYEVIGTGDPLVLLMGFGADGAVWEKHLAVYQKHFQCIVIDNRGVGKSDQPTGPYTTAMMAADTIAVMDHAGVAKARVAGISMGGAIAQELALNYPDRVHSLVLISTWPRFNHFAKAMYQNLKNIRPSVEPDVFMQLLQLWIFAPPHFEANLKGLQEGQQAAKANVHPQSQAGFEGQLDACIQHDTVDRLHQIKVPTMITVGDMDIMTPPAFAQILQEKIAGAQYVHFPTGGHAHHWEDLERFNQVTTDFLRNH
jgi:pimeloyl-ACP methyl ester carboxylesterase